MSGRPVPENHLREAVIREIQRDPAIAAGEIEVTVEDGVVILWGFVDSCGDRFGAERAARRVPRVRAIANDLQVKALANSDWEDAEVARTLVREFDAHPSLRSVSVQVTVREGSVALDGEVDWKYQSMAAEDVLRRTAGVRAIENRLTVRCHDAEDTNEIPRAW